MNLLAELMVCSLAIGFENYFGFGLVSYFWCELETLMEVLLVS